MMIYAAIWFFATVHAAPAANAKPSGRIENKNTVAVPASSAPAYRYSSKGKADPFKPFMETDIAVITKRNEEQKRRQTKTVAGTLSPLQKDAISRFVLVGIVGDFKERIAVVEDKAANRHYPIFPGTYIGQNGGRVETILADRVIVKEIVQDENTQNKKQQYRTIEILLHNDQ